jgi:hypothetical protein
MQMKKPVLNKLTGQITAVTVLLFEWKGEMVPPPRDHQYDNGTPKR